MAKSNSIFFLIFCWSCIGQGLRSTGLPCLVLQVLHEIHSICSAASIQTSIVFLHTGVFCCDISTQSSQIVQCCNSVCSNMGRSLHLGIFGGGGQVGILHNNRIIKEGYWASGRISFIFSDHTEITFINQFGHITISLSTQGRLLTILVHPPGELFTWRVKLKYQIGRLNLTLWPYY